ncbi:glutamate 5-kinase [Jannaschia faecimaris]|uniref:Glutamate 5-kinase n=1 Tax=Jannaschia faecimaris TaxID=1244108 RepID=A0A1H3T687_9RHOB|nr:glutamate 5-kinase [Jannaschia faecimaris]SDZ45437.1 glutamate 5-kinase [Jannaschia faecimaris]
MVACLNDAKRIVIKIGSALLVDAVTGAPRVDWLKGLTEDVAMLRAEGKEVILVSSGSIALGRRMLGITGPLSLEQSQAAAAVGQIRLSAAYEAALQPLPCAQVLLTLHDSENRRRYLNLRNTFKALLDLGVVPIVNENDTVATDEIRYGDNDRLAAQVAAMAGADVCILLSDVDGLYTANPNLDPEARHLPVVREITDEIAAMAGEGVSGVSKGGMITKILAARTATAAGCALVIALGHQSPIRALRSGARSTWFMPKDDPHSARKRWINAMKPRGVITIDDGAARALGRGSSLLPAGVTAISGEFGRGEPVRVEDQRGNLVTYGLTNYAATEATLIMGLQSDEVAGTLGYAGRTALVHRDDMAM